MKTPSLNFELTVEDYSLSYSFNLKNTRNYCLDVRRNLGGNNLKNEYLYKFYASNEFSFESLCDGYFYLNSPDKFNDPFDCSVHQEETMQKKYPMRKNIYENLGVSCFTNNFKNPSMWDRYTSDYSGFCAKFKKDQLVDRSQIEIGTNVFYTNQHYNSLWFYTKFFEQIDNEPLSESAKNDIKFVVTIVHKYGQKSIEWQNEDEYRIISLRCLENERQLKFKYENLEELYLGYKMTELNKEIIFEIVRKYCPNCNVFTVKPSNHKRELILENCNSY